jgi:hypothetical protein
VLHPINCPIKEIAMFDRILFASVLAMALAAPQARAQSAAPPSAQAAANPVSADAVQALKDMGAHLQTLKRFEVSTELTGERVLADGQKLQHAASATLQVERPNRMRVMMRSARSERELIYDGKTVALNIPALKHYSRVEFTGTVGELVSRLEDKFAVELPLSDLFAWGTPAAPLDRIDSAMNAGQDLIDGELCDHYAFRQGDIDWQVWITATGKPLPRKLVITSRADEARPQSASLIRWNLKPNFTPATFKFTPPKGATAVELLPRKAN